MSSAKGGREAGGGALSPAGNIRFGSRLVS